MFALLLATALAAQTTTLAPPPPTSAAPVAAAATPRPATVRVVLTTSEGPITLELEKERAPVTTANFLKYVDARRLDGINFYRAMKLGDGLGLIQGGVREVAKLYPPIMVEPTSKTGLRHTDGVISMARGAPGSAQADFFIIVGSMPSLDADPAQPGDNLGYAAFGHVVEGMDLVRRILAAPTSPTAGDGAMRGQMLAAPLRIVSARRVKP